MRKTLTVRIRVNGDKELVVKGRDAWALNKLIEAGNKGCTPIDNPGPRWSGYVFDLRSLGIHIETIHEAHTGPFPGTHARYILRSRIDVLELVNDG